MAMEQIILKRDDARDLKFTGEEIASYRDDDPPGRGCITNVYRTKAGNFVVHEHEWTHWQGESDRQSANIFNTPKEVIDHLGAGSEIAKEFCEKLDIDNCEHVA